MKINNNVIQIFDRFEKWEQNIAHALSQNLDLFKLLKYEDNDPLPKPIDSETIENMLSEYDLKQQANPECKVFFRRFNDKVEATQKAQLRIYPWRIKPSNMYLGDMIFYIEIIVHMGIDTIKNGRRRHRIASEIVRSLNGLDIGMVKDVAIADMVMFQNPNKPDFDGWTLVFTTGVSVR